MIIVLVAFDRCDRPGGSFFFGVPTEVAGESLSSLLSMQHEGRPVFMSEQELNTFPMVSLQLAEPEKGFSFYDRRIYGAEIVELREPLAETLIRRGYFVRV